eukprot:COSAG06_NODE_16440_length_1001_cov_1.811530_1_plen_110_part_10
MKIRRSSHGRFEWEELLCPGSSPRLTYIRTTPNIYTRAPRDRAARAPAPARRRRGDGRLPGTCTGDRDGPPRVTTEVLIARYLQRDVEEPAVLRGSGARHACRPRRSACL